MCVKCWKPATPGACMCAECRERYRKAQRKRSGCKPWKSGNRGRPPIGENNPSETTAEKATAKQD